MVDVIARQVRRARRRLVVEQLVARLTWCLCGACLAALPAVALRKWWDFGVDDRLWAAGWIGGALGIGLVVALAWTVAARRSPLAAALEIDRRFGLKERVSSALALTADERATPVGCALAEDAARRVDGLEIGERFAWGLGRRSLLPLCPLALVVALAIGLEARVADQSAQAQTLPANAQQVKMSTESLHKKLAEQRHQAKKLNLPEADSLFQKLEDGTKDLAAQKEVDQKGALNKLNDLAKELENRRQHVATGEKLKEQLNELAKDLGQGPGDKLAKALKRGDFRQAAAELDKLKNQLAKNGLDEQQQKQLADQLGKMQDKMNRLAEAHEKAKADLRNKIDKLQAAGQQQQAQKLQQQLDKLLAQQPQMKDVQKLADQLAKAAACMQQGNCPDAAKALAELGQALENTQANLDEMELLDQALAQLADAKSAMNCKQCQGQGCAACQGQGQNNKVVLADFARGRGRASGARPEEKTDTDLYDSRVRQELGKGAAVARDQIEGPNIKGQIEQQIKAEFDAAASEATDPLTGQRLPRDYRDGAKKYFDSLRDGS